MIWDAAPYTGKYSELNTGSFWRDAQIISQAKELGCHIMPVGLYTDKSIADFKQSIGLKPVIVTCGNYIGQVTRSQAGKRCVGYYPEVKVFLVFVLHMAFRKGNVWATKMLAFCIVAFLNLHSHG